MSRYLISFDDGWMRIPEAELPAVADAAHAVIREAKAAGVYVHGGGVLPQRASVVDVDGSVSQGPLPETKAVLGGFTIVKVGSHDEALDWARKLARACRTRQEVRMLGDDPEA